jgi:hypothetical protein
VRFGLGTPVIGAFPKIFSLFAPLLGRDAV